MTSSEEGGSAEEASIYFVLFSWLLAVVIILSKVLHGYPKLNVFVSEAALILIVGMVAGFCIHLYVARYGSEEEEERDENADEVDEELYRVASNLLSFSPSIFFMALLPPIMFNSGYQLRRELFYRHITPIVTLATVGTMISAFCTGMCLYGISLLGYLGDFAPTRLELLTFGSLIAATDAISVLAVFQSKQVDPHLYYLVFGESSLNDAVALVLFKTFSALLVQSAEGVVDSIAQSSLWFLADFMLEAVGSPALGTISGCITALIFKYVDFREHKSLELPLYIVLLMYVPFIVAEFLHLSGIVAIFFSGIAARRYVSPNASEETAKNAEVIFKLAAYLAETCIFLELGLSVFGLSGSFRWSFIGYAFVASLFGRALGIYPLTLLWNWSLKETATFTTTTLASSAKSQNSDESSASGSSFLETGSTEAKDGVVLRKKRKTPMKRRDKKISSSFMHVLWFAGLRGAVAYACVRDFPEVFGHNDEFIAATMVIVLVTIIVMGGATEHLLRYLKIDMGVDVDDYMIEWHRQRELRGPIHRFGTFHPHTGRVVVVLLLRFG